MIIFSVVIALAVLIILNSVLFSVQHVHAVCWNDNDIALDETIESNHGIRLGSSIFVLNEEKTAESLKDNLIEQGIANVEVLSLERRFPNRVVIHYIKIVDYFYVVQDGQAYYFSNRGATLTAIKPISSPTGNTIQLKIGGTLTSTEIGSTFGSTVAGERERVLALLQAYERTEGLMFSSLRNYFEFVDIAGDYIFIKSERGVFFRFHSLDNFSNQFALALSTYMAFRDDPTQVLKVLSGTIILSPTESAAYDQNILYAP